MEIKIPIYKWSKENSQFVKIEYISYDKKYWSTVCWIINYVLYKRDGDERSMFSYVKCNFSHVEVVDESGQMLSKDCKLKQDDDGLKAARVFYKGGRTEFSPEWKPITLAVYTWS
jgi:hypothetical protein